MTDPENNWISWARSLQAMAQNGLLYTRDAYDRERYERIRKISAAMMAKASGAGADAAAGVIHSQLVRELGHATPKVDVRGAVFRENRVLLVKERSDGGWTLPGGWAEVDDTPAEATIREVREESGFESVATKLLAAYDLRRHGHPEHPIHIYKLFFLCELVGGQATPSDETAAVDFFEEGDLPPLSLPRVTAEQIHRMFEHHRNPDLATDFD